MVWPLLTDWVGENGWLWTLELQFRGMNFPGDRLLGWGRVVSTTRRGQYGVVKGTALLTKYFPESAANPTTQLVKLCKSHPLGVLYNHER